jgi:hypothetical protein
MSLKTQVEILLAALHVFSHRLCVFFLFFFFLALLSPFLFPLFAMALSLGSSLSWPLSVLRAAVMTTIFLAFVDLAPQIPFVLSQPNLHLAEVIRALWVMAVSLPSR